MSVYVCGDTHLDIDIVKLDKKYWGEGQQLTKDDYLIILGDAGIVWFNESNGREEDVIEWYNEKPWTTLFVDGNHENFDRLFSKEFPEIEMFESEVKQISESIFYLQRGHIYKIEDKTILTFGGGESIDKNARIINIDWWSQEIPKWYEMDRGIENLNKFSKRVNFILTHTCSEKTFNLLPKDFYYKSNAERSLREYFNWIESNVEFDQWHFGHFHDDIQLDSKHFLHFDEKPFRII